MGSKTIKALWDRIDMLEVTSTGRRQEAQIRHLGHAAKATRIGLIPKPNEESHERNLTDQT